MIDLVCSTLGMKVSFRTHNMPRIKAIFIEEVFTEQVSKTVFLKMHILHIVFLFFFFLQCVHLRRTHRIVARYLILFGN